MLLSDKEFTSFAPSFYSSDSISDSEVEEAIALELSEQFGAQYKHYPDHRGRVLFSPLFVNPRHMFVQCINPDHETAVHIVEGHRLLLVRAINRPDSPNLDFYTTSHVVSKDLVPLLGKPLIDNPFYPSKMQVGQSFQVSDSVLYHPKGTSWNHFLTYPTLRGNYETVLPTAKSALVPHREIHETLNLSSVPEPTGRFILLDPHLDFTSCTIGSAFTHSELSDSELGLTPFFTSADPSGLPTSHMHNYEYAGYFDSSPNDTQNLWRGHKVFVFWSPLVGRLIGVLNTDDLPNDFQIYHALHLIAQGQGTHRLALNSPYKGTEFSLVPLQSSPLLRRIQGFFNKNIVYNVPPSSHLAS